MLRALYELISESLRYHFFNTKDVFKAIGISQPSFFDSVLALMSEAYGRTGILDHGLELYGKQNIAPSCLESNLAEIFVEYLDIPDLKAKGVEKVMELLRVEENASPEAGERISDHIVRTNRFVYLGFVLHMGLLEKQAAVDFFKRYYVRVKGRHPSEVLIDWLFEYRQKELLIAEIEEAMRRGERLGSRIESLRAYVEEYGELPNRF